MSLIGSSATFARYQVTEIEVIASVVLRNPNRRRGKDGDLKVSFHCEELPVNQTLMIFRQQDPLRDAWKEAVETILELAAHAMPTIQPTDNKKFTPLQIFAVAAYRVTYESLRPSPDNDIVFEEGDMPSACKYLKSFAWILPQELMSVMQK